MITLDIETLFGNSNTYYNKTFQQITYARKISQILSGQIYTNFHTKHHF